MKKRGNPDHDTPPKVSEKKNKKEDVICIICDSIVLEDNEDDEEQIGDEAIFCEGLCQGWLHRKCAGLSNTFFKKFTGTNRKFLCVFCQLFEQVTLVEELREDVNNLKAKLADAPPGSEITVHVSFINELKEDVKGLKTKLSEPVAPGSVDSEQINELKADVENLKSKLSEVKSGQVTSDSQAMETESSGLTAIEPIALKEIKSQITELATSIDNHQKLFETKERANRASNLVIIGLEESSVEDNPINVVKDFLNDKLNLTNISIVQARRLGKVKQSSNNTKYRPVLVTFSNFAERKQVLSNCSKLAGTQIYINFDLTKQQMSEEKQLREARRKLKQLEKFKDKQISIFRNKLYVDRSPISPDQLQAAGIKLPTSPVPLGGNQ